MIAGALVGGVASVMQLGNHYRAQLGPMTVREARELANMPVTTIAAARDGLVKIKGRVVGTTTEMSYYDRVPCVALALEHYEVREGIHGAKRVLMRSEKWLHPFFIEDETGRIQLDPKSTRIDYVRQGTDYESTIRLGISLGGDSDTLAGIAGGIAAAAYGGVPTAIRTEVEARLAPAMRTILAEFLSRYPSGG